MAYSNQPSELLELILFQIEDRKTIDSFSRTCKRFNSVAHTEITAQQFKSFTGEWSDIEARSPWGLLLASHKARQITSWALAAPKSDRPEQLMEAIEGGTKSLAAFAIQRLGLTYLDVLLQRDFYLTTYEPLGYHLWPVLETNSKCRLHPDQLDPTLLTLAIYLELCHHDCMSKVQSAIADRSLKTPAAKRRSIGQPQSSKYGGLFLKYCDSVLGETTSCNYTEVRRLIRLMTKHVNGLRWPTWRANDNGADIAAHIYGLAGFLSLFEGRIDRLPPKSVLDALSNIQGKYVGGRHR